MSWTGTRLADRISRALPAGAAGVLSLLALDTEPLSGRPAVSGGLAGTLTLVQALGAAAVEAPLWLLTCGAVAAGPGEAAASPVQAQTWGLGRVAGLEHPDRWGGLIDVPAALDERAAERLGAVLAGCGEDQVVIRAAGIMARRLTRAQPPGTGRSWVPDGTVLVTGATGSVGGPLARWIAERGAPRLVLTSRGGAATPGAARLAAELAGLGAQAEVIGCDVAQRAQVAGLIARVGADGPPLSAVMHAAVAVNLMPVDVMDIDELAVTLGAKVAGATWLDELTQDLDLKQFVLFSSIAATWGVSEHGAYAAANAHLDALAGHRRARGLAATTVAWGVWDAGDWVRSEAVASMPQSVDPARLRLAGTAVPGAGAGADRAWPGAGRRRRRSSRSRTWTGRASRRSSPRCGHGGCSTRSPKCAR